MLEVGKLGATRQTWKQKNIRDVFADIKTSHPSASENKLRREFRSIVRNDDDLIDSVIDYAFDNAFLTYERHKARTQEPLSAEARADRAEIRAKEAREAAKKVEYIKEQIILLNQELPNGKRARFCTLDYLYKLGGAYKNAGKKGSCKLVGQAYTEEEYRQKLRGVI